MKKITENIIQIINKPYSWLFLLPLSFVFLLIYSDSTSPLFFKQGWDSAIFKVMGLGILEGKLPYRDIFDHKGPLLFYINALGQWIIPGKTGIFILENLFLSTTLLFIVKTASLFVDKGKSYLIAIFFLIGLSGLLDDGNLSEFYILPFISVSLYCCMKYFTGKSDIHPLSYSFFFGFC